jgi:hypothetical protein
MHDTCELKFHFPDTTPAEMASLPMRALLPLLEVMDPPTELLLGETKAWVTRNIWDESSNPYAFHRDYDLPAVIHGDGTMQWWQRDKQHRDGDKPAHVGRRGEQYWYQHGNLHREGGLPATIEADGAAEYYLNGEEVDVEGNPLW